MRSDHETCDGLHAIILNDYCYVQGGGSRVAIDEALGLSRAGITVTFLGAVGPICEELKNSSVKVIHLEQTDLLNFRRQRGVVLQTLWNRDAYAATGSALRLLGPSKTIVHVHGYTKSLSASPIRAAAELGFSVVCTLHDFFSACPNGAFFNFTENRPCSLRGLSLACIGTNCDKRMYVHKLFRVTRSLAQRYVGKFPRSVTEYIALSQRSAALLKPYLPQGASVHHLPNPIDVALSSPVDAASNTEIMMVGRLDSEKGVAMLVDAARLVRCKLTLVGEGPWRTYAEKYSECTVTGWLPRSEVMSTLERAVVWYFQAYGTKPSAWSSTRLPLGAFLRS